MNRADLPLAFQRCHHASRQQPDVPWPLRRHRLQQLARMIRQHRHAIADALNADFGHRSRDETDLLEIFPSLAGIGHALKHGRRWMRPQRVSTDWWFWPASNRIVPQPVGVVGIVVPWNYPLYLAAAPLTGALAAGNRVLIKTSEAAPAFAHWLAATVPQYFAADEVTVINGGADIAAEFCALPFDHLLFTGSTAIGRQVMQTAAANLTPVTLELGGKSPVLVLADADLPQAAARIMAGKLLNAGQTCIAPDYVLVPAPLLAALREQLCRWTAQHYPDLARNPDYSHIINPQQQDRLQAWLQEAAAAGARIWPLAPAGSNSGTRLLPHLLEQVPEHCTLMQAEIFGPLLPLVQYTDLAQALAYVQARPRPLALYVFGRNRQHIDHVLRNTVSGGVCVNDTLLHVVQEALPFGGIGASGMGAYHGRTGFDTFSHRKPIFRQSHLNSTALLAPPYGRRFRRLLQLLLQASGAPKN